jgi:hypothetical protein
MRRQGMATDCTYLSNNINTNINLSRDEWSQNSRLATSIAATTITTTVTAAIKTIITTIMTITIKRPILFLPTQS